MQTSERRVLLVTIHSVPDFDAYRSMVNSLPRDRISELGVVRRSLYQAADNPNEIMMVIEARSVEDAKKIMKSGDQFRELFERAGVTIYPPVFVGEEAERIEFASE